MTTAAKVGAGAAGVLTLLALEFDSPVERAAMRESSYESWNAGEVVGPPLKESCHSSYSGACLDPDASDYDCTGGSGNGPYYTGRVQVVGPDVFDLDRDGNGYGC
jgi:hypothetical protein